jgi:hypothetical protein
VSFAGASGFDDAKRRDLLELLSRKLMNVAKSQVVENSIGPELGTRKRVCLILTLCCIVCGCLTVAIADPDQGSRRWQYLLVGVVLGTIYGHGTLAAAWTVLGPGSFRIRCVISILWILALAVAFRLNVGKRGGPNLEIVVMVAAFLFMQWLLAQVPLWALTKWYGVRLRDTDDSNWSIAHRPTQFGIRQLMILTAGIAVVLAIGRIVLPWLSRFVSPRAEELLTFGFLTIAGVLMTLSLLLAALLPRYALIATLIVAALIALGTYWEFPLLKQFAGGGGPNFNHLLAINVVQCSWILLIACLMNCAGFVLRTPAA